MERFSLSKFATGASALVVPLVVLAFASPAQAQSPTDSNCAASVLIDPEPFFFDPDGPGPLPPILIDDPPYFEDVEGIEECGHTAGTLPNLANTLAGIGDGFVQQQLNFATGFGTFASPTGRVRKTRHDGLTEKGANATTEDFAVSEGSVFANFTYDMPGTAFGGKLRFSGLAGYDRMTQKADSNSYLTEIDSFIYGGSYLWSSGSFYTMTLIIGLTGEADSRNAGGTYDYDVSGYYSNSVVGNTFDLGATKFDLRVGVGSHDIDGGRFTVPGTVTTLKGETSAWNGSITGTLFTITDMGGGAVARPYFLASYKHVFDEEIEITSNTGNVIEYEQGEDFGRLEGGFDVVQGIYTFGAAIYTEFSEDQGTVGGRLGVSVQLQ